MFPEIDRILIDRERIAARVAELGQRIAADLQAELARDPDAGAADGRIVLVPILTGSIVFVADLIRQLPLKMSLGVVTITSYPGRATASQGAAVRGDLPPDLAGRHVLIVDDVLDSGRTLSLVHRLVREQDPASLRVCVLLRKPEAARAVPFEADYVGFDIPDEFVVGYGLDYDGYYRNYPEIATLRFADRGTPDEPAGHGHR